MCGFLWLTGAPPANRRTTPSSRARSTTLAASSPRMTLRASLLACEYPPSDLLSLTFAHTISTATRSPTTLPSGRPSTSPSTTPHPSGSTARRRPPRTTARRVWSCACFLTSSILSPHTDLPPRAINSDESSARDFAAFQALAKQTNTSSAASNSDTTTTGDDNGALGMPMGGAATVLAVVMGLFALML